MASDANETEGQEELVLDPEDGIEDLNEDKEVIPYNFEITAYGADYDVEGLVNSDHSPSALE